MSQYDNLERLTGVVAYERFKQECQELALLPVPEVAGKLNLSTDYLYRYLRDNKWLYRQGGWRAHRARVLDDLMDEPYIEYIDEQGNHACISEPMITVKGRIVLAALIRPPISIVVGRRLITARQPQVGQSHPTSGPLRG